MSQSAAAVSPKSTDKASSHEEPAKPTSPKPTPQSVPLKEIEAAIRSVRHGVVQIIIQDGVVIQIDRTEKVRLR